VTIGVAQWYRRHVCATFATRKVLGERGSRRLDLVVVITEPYQLAAAQGDLYFPMHTQISNPYTKHRSRRSLSEPDGSQELKDRSGVFEFMHYSFHCCGVVAGISFVTSMLSVYKIVWLWKRLGMHGEFEASINRLHKPAGACLDFCHFPQLQQAHQTLP
jgi:hypothetical protein